MDPYICDREMLHCAQEIMPAVLSKISIHLPPELLDLIVGFVAMFPDHFDTRKSLLDLAITSKCVSVFALNGLWGRFQHSLTPLLKLINPNIWRQDHGFAVGALSEYCMPN
jgi:hypothetical protein